MALVAVLLLGCNGDKPKERSFELGAEHHSGGSYEGVRFVTVFERESNEQAPLLVLMHGLGDTPEHFRSVWHDFPIKLQLSLPDGLEPQGDGRQWFEWPYRASDAELAAAVTRAEAKLWPALEKVAHGRKIMIGGFSQGAVMTYAFALHHADAIACAFPISGRMPAALLTRDQGPIAPIVALHGDADERISIEDDRASIALLVAAGANAQLVEFPGVGHTVTSEMVATLVTQVKACIK